MIRLVHLIPYHDIGGVEVAARSLEIGRHDELNFERNYLIRIPNSTIELGEHHGPKTSVNDPRAYWHAICRLYRDPPNILVASLWRSALVLIFLKFLRPRTKMVLFLHSGQDAHFVDKVISRVAMLLSDSIWADSDTTLEHRVPRQLRGKGRIVSFLLSRKSMPEQRNPTPEFIFWGRLTAEKGLDHALDLIAAVVRHRPDTRFTVIGPDGGMENHLRSQVVKLGLCDHITFKGRMEHEAIQDAASRASFYLQPSLREGMAISVVEAMQSGLVPVVTPVGEIARYCEDNRSAVFVYEDDEVVETVLALLSDSHRYRQMSTAAAQYWRTQPLYRDDFLNAANEVMAS